MTFDNETPSPSPSAGSHYQPKLSVVIVILVLFVGAAFFTLRSSNPSVPGSTSTTSTTTAGTHSTTTTVKQKVESKSKVSVQVANGTNTSGLARIWTTSLLTDGWDTLSAVNGPHVKATIIFYAAGYEWAAKEISTELKVPATSLQTLDHKNPVPLSSGDDIVVVLGPNVGR